VTPVLMPGLSGRVDELARQLEELRDAPQDTIADTNTIFINGKGEVVGPGEGMNWRGPWKRRPAYARFDVVKFAKGLYIATVDIPEAAEPAFPNPALAHKGKFFGAAAPVEEWLDNEQEVIGPDISAVDTADHLADLQPAEHLHVSEEERWRLYALSITANTTIKWNLVGLPLAGVSGVISLGFMRADGGGEGSDAFGLVGIGERAIEKGVYIVNVEHWEKPLSGPWPFSFKLTSGAISNVLGNPTPAEDGRWELMTTGGGGSTGGLEWKPLPYAAGMADFGGGQETGEYALDAFGMVHTKGFGKAGEEKGIGATLAALPAGFRPAGKLYVPTILYDGTFHLNNFSVTPTGLMAIETGGTVLKLGNALQLTSTFKQVN
jgi:hypothetical protein